jgi:carotenoid cleavage dioxygenase-like enzyme
MVKAPGTQRLTLNYDEPLSNVAFGLNLRRYIEVAKISATGEVENTAALPLPSANMVMIHDAAMSANHLVFILPPYALTGLAGGSLRPDTRPKWNRPAESARAYDVLHSP